MPQQRHSPGRTVPITRLARVIRSKNASPFVTTIDFFFPDEESYRLVRDSGVMTVERVAAVLGIPVADVLGVHFYDVAWGIKVSVVKPGHVASGDPGCADGFGAQLYVPFLALEIPVPPQAGKG